MSGDVGATLGDWTLTDVEEAPMGRLVTALRPDGARVTVVVAARDYPHALARCAEGALYYRDAAGVDGPTAVTLVRQLATASDRGEVSLAVRPRPRDHVEGWRARRVVTDRYGRVFVELAREEGQRLNVGVAPRGYPQALVRSRAGDLYLDAREGLDEASAREVLERFGAMLDEGAFPLPRLFPHLAMDRAAGRDPMTARRALLDAIDHAALPAPSPGGEAVAPAEVPRVATDASTALALAREVTLVFDPPGLAEFLAPELAVGGPAVARHVLRAIYLPPVARREAVRFDAYTLDFASVVDGSVTRVEARAGATEAATFAAPQGIAFAPMGVAEGANLAPDVASLCSWLAALVYLKAPAGLRVEVPTRVEALRALSVPAARATEAVAPQGDSPVAPQGDAVLNLVLDADCGQRCAFCSVKSYVTPTDRGDDELAEVSLQLREARVGGAAVVRLNGIDPLAHSRVLEVARAARDLGFARMDVFSPGRRLGDRAFLDALLEASPPALEVTLPFYGATARTHDAVVGVEGAHAEVTRALHALRARGSRVRLRVSTVALRTNLDELAALWGLARRNGASFDAKLPYPMRSTVGDVYADVATRETEIAERAVAQAAELPAEQRLQFYVSVGALVVHPCVLFRVERDRGAPLLGARNVGASRMLPGTEYRSKVYLHGGSGAAAFAASTRPCPEAPRCALAPVCPREVYSVYADLFGMDELRAVSPRDLYALAPNPKALAIPRPAGD